MQSLQNAVVVVTGAASGIGKATAEAFADAGARLALVDINSVELARLAETIQDRASSPSVSVAVADLRTEKGVRDGIVKALAPYDGRVDVLFANVGVVVKGPFEDLTAQQWQDAFAIDFFSHVYAIQTVVPLMKERGGCIITNCSDQALQPDEGLSPYAAAKAALMNLTKCLARELAPHQIRVNGIAPGMTRTALIEAEGGLMDQFAQEYHLPREEAMRYELGRRGVPLARLGEAHEVAQAVLYLATANFCTATILNISGGNVRSMIC